MTGGSTTVTGTFNSSASTEFTLEFFSNTTCSASLHGEGKSFLGSAAVTTNEQGNASLNETFAATVPDGGFVTATATDTTDGSTSEFSLCRARCEPMKLLMTVMVNTDRTEIACNLLEAEDYSVEVNGTFKCGITIGLRDGFSVLSGSFVAAIDPPWQLPRVLQARKGSR